MINYDTLESSKDSEPCNKHALLNFANLIKSTMGIGICGLSRIYCSTGVPLGIAILVLMGALSFWAQRTVLRFKEKHQVRSLEEVAEKVLGKPGKWIIRTALAVNVYCSMICLFTFIGEFTFPLLRIIYPLGASQKSAVYKLLVGCTSAIVFPLTWFKKLEILGFSSTLGMICLIVLIISTVAAAILEGSIFQRPQYSPSTDILSIITCFGISLMANHGQHAICDIHTDSKQKSSLTKASVASCSFVTIMNITLSLIVYFTFGEQQHAQQDMLFVNFKLENMRASWALATGTVLYCITIIVTLPLYNFYFRRLAWDSLQDAKGDLSEDEMPTWFRMIWSTIAWASATLISVFTPKAMDVLDFSGLFSCTITMILLPLSIILSKQYQKREFRIFDVMYGFLLLGGLYLIGHSIRDLIMTITKG